MVACSERLLPKVSGKVTLCLLVFMVNGEKKGFYSGEMEKIIAGEKMQKMISSLYLIFFLFLSFFFLISCIS